MSEPAGPAGLWQHTGVSGGGWRGREVDRSSSPFDRLAQKRTRGDGDEEGDEDDLEGACQVLLGRCSAEIDRVAASVAMSRAGKRRKTARTAWDRGGGGGGFDRRAGVRWDESFALPAGAPLYMPDGSEGRSVDAHEEGDDVMMDEGWGGEAASSSPSLVSEGATTHASDEVDTSLMDETVASAAAAWDGAGSPPWGRSANSASDEMVYDDMGWPQRLDSDGNPFALASRPTVELSSELTRILKRLGLQWYVQPDGSLLANGGVEISEWALTKLRFKMDADGVIRIQTTNDAGDTMLVEGTLSPAPSHSGGAEGSKYRVNIRVSLLYQWPRRIEAIEAAPFALALPAPQGWAHPASCRPQCAGLSKRGWALVDDEEGSGVNDDDYTEAASPVRATSPWRPAKKLRTHTPTQSFLFGRARVADDDIGDVESDDARGGKRRRYFESD